MSLDRALMQQYPGITIGPFAGESECVLAEGQIEYWGRPEPEPDPADVLAAFDARSDAKLLRLTEIRAEAKTVIEAKWPDWRQNNCALGVYDAATTQQCADDIAAVIQASNTAEDAVDAATTIAAVEAVTPTWPSI